MGLPLILAFDVVSVQGHFGVNQCTYLKLAYNWKTAGHTVTEIEIWDSGVVLGLFGG